MTGKENLESYKVMVNFNQDLINNTKTFKKLKFYPVIEVDNDLYKIELDTNPDTLINVNCINVPTGISSNSRIDINHYFITFKVSLAVIFTCTYQNLHIY